MTTKKKRLQNFGKRLLRISLILLISLIIFFGVAWNVLKSDHNYVIQKIKETALEKYNVDLNLTSYQLEFTRPFPLINFQFNNLSIASSNRPEDPFLRVGQANSTFQPWDLIFRNFRAEPLFLDSVWVYLHKDTLDESNHNFGNDEEHFSRNKKRKRIDFKLKRLPNIKINYLDFHRKDEFRKKEQWVKLNQATIQPKKNDQGNWIANLVTDAYFEGLIFNKKEGGFLMNEKGMLDLKIGLEDRGKVIRLANSSLEVYDKTTFLLDGKFTLADTNRFELQIASEGVTMKTVLPMLSRKINRVLKNIKIDEPIQANFSLDKFLKSGKKEVIQIDFETADAELVFKGVDMNSCSLKGSFSNDCDQDGIGSFATACLNVEYLDGVLLGIIPMQLHGGINQLNNPKVDVYGKIDLNLPELNSLLASKDKFTFTKGTANADFHYQGELMNLLTTPFDEQDILLRGDAYFDKMTVKTDNRFAPSPSLSGHLSFDENQAMLDEMNLDWMGSKVSISGRVGNLPEFLFFDKEAINLDLSLRFDELDMDSFIENTSEKNKTKNDNKIQPISSEPLNYQRLERMTRRLASSVNGQVKLQVDKLVFDTLFVTDLQTKVRLFTPRRAEYVDSFMIQMNQLSANFMGTTPFYLDVGLSRDSIAGVQIDLNLPSVFEPAQIFLPKNIRLTQGDISMKISTLAPLRFLLEPQQLISNLAYNAIVDFDETEIESDLFSWPIRKMSGPISFDNQQLRLDNLGFSYEDSPFLISGEIDNYTFFQKENYEKARVDLKIKGEYLNLKNENEVTQNKPISPAELFQSLDTVFQQVTGKIDLSLDSILLDKHPIYPFLLRAQLVADENNSEEHLLQVDSFNLGFGEKNNIKGHAQIKNPRSPNIEAHFKTRLKFKKLGEFLTSDFMEMKKGYFNMDLDYRSPLFDTINAENYLLKADVQGKAEIVDGKIFYNYRGFTFKNIYAHFTFDEKAIFFRDVDLEVNENRMFASGQSLDFFPFFILPNRRVIIDMTLASPRFDFGKFTSPHGLGKDTMMAFVNEIVQANQVGRISIGKDTTINVLEKTGSFIDQLLGQGTMEMVTTCEELVYNNFLAKKVEGKISLQPDSVQIKKLNMDVAEGKFMVDGSISNVALHQPKLEIAVTMKENNVSEIFRQFDDFGQSALGHKNMEGIASANIFFQTQTNSDYSILPNTMHGEMDIKLTGGQLLEVGSLKKVSGFLFRKRQMNKILMDTLQASMHIRGTDLYIDDFFLHSSSFDFGIQGVYSFGAENKTRILFKVPVSNLYRRHLTPTQMMSGDSKRKGMRILIEAKQKKEQLRFRWKLFNWKKKKYQLIEEKENG